MDKPMENYTERLAKLTKQLVASRFLRWWTGELASMVPGRLRQAGPGMGDYALVGMHGADLVVRPQQGGKAGDECRLPVKSADAAGQRTAFIAALDKLQAGRRDVALVLPPGRVLRKTLALPLATEENLRQVLEFQMEQHTPFTPAQVYFGHRLAGRDFGSGQLTVEFAATPRDAVDEAVKTLAGWGARVRAVVAEDMLANGQAVNLRPAVQGRAPSTLLRGANPWLAALVLLLALATLIVPLVIKREAILQLNPWVEKGKVAAEATDALRRELETRVEQHNYLPEKKRMQPPVIIVLEELSRVLPDDTWVQQMDVKGKELQIQGETGSSSRLVSLFEQSAMFHDASFRSPLTKGQGAGTERYHLALEIRPLPQAQPGAPSAAPQVAAEGAATVKPESKTPAPAMEKKP